MKRKFVALSFYRLQRNNLFSENNKVQFKVMLLYFDVLNGKFRALVLLCPPFLVIIFIQLTQNLFLTTVKD